MIVQTITHLLTQRGNEIMAFGIGKVLDKMNETISTILECIDNITEMITDLNKRVEALEEPTR